MSAELELYREPESPRRRGWVELMEPAAKLATQIAGTDFVPAGLRSNPAAIAACILYGDEVGLGPMQALSKIAVIDGRPSLSSEAMRSLIFAAGHDLWVEESSSQKAVVAGRRSDSQQTTRVTWTLEDAKRAGLAGKSNWRAYPRQMLTARATAELSRLIFADAIGGLSATEELEELEATIRPEEPEAKRPTGKLRRRESAPLAVAEPPAATPAAAPTPAPPPLPGEPGHEGAREPLSDPQRRKLHAMFRERGVSRQERLEWVSATLGRSVASFTELTRLEGSTLIEALEGDDIPFGLPGTQGAVDTPGRTIGDMEAESVAEAEPEPAEELGEEPAGEEQPLSLVMFKARIVQEGFAREDVARVGRELYSGRSLAELSDEERTRLLEALESERWTNE